MTTPIPNHWPDSKQPISSIITILFIFGVDLKQTRRPGSKESKLRCIYQKIMALIWMLSLVHMAVTFVTVDIVLHKVAKSMLARKLSDFNAFALWITLVTRRRMITSTVNDFFLLPTFKFKSVLASLITIVIIFVVPVIGWMSLAVDFTESACMLFMEYILFQTSNVPKGYNCLALQPILLIYNIAIYTLRTAFSGFYVMLCYMLRYVICNYVKSVRKRLSCRKTQFSLRDINQCFKTYDAAITVLKSMEKSMSFPIFLVQISDLISLFWGFILFDPLGQKKDNQGAFESYQTAMVFVFLRALVSFLCVSLAASSVHEADKAAKEVNEEALKRVILFEGGRKENFEEFTALCILNQNQPITLSAGGFFYFTKGMVLSAVGSVLTYSLLLLQINFN